MKTDQLSTREARRIALASGSGFRRPATKGVAAVGEIVDRLGFVQIDTISVVERAHHHILASRIPRYQPDWLEKAAVFEYWAHAASFLPWRDFRHTLPRKRRILTGGHDWFKTDRAEADRVLQRIREEGPLMARDFEAPQQKAGWWDWKPAKRALEFQFMAGELMITRKGFQKVFDLTERVLPRDVDTRTPTPAEHTQWYVERALDVWGLVARDEIAYQRSEHLDQIGEVLRDQTEAGHLVKVLVEGWPKTPYWVRAADLALLDQTHRRDGTLRILSPFDPFVIHRKRLHRLFGFEFTIECYVPEPKRTFGYFALPLLQGDEIVGLLDAKADRAAGRLLIRKLRYDGSPQKRQAFDAALPAALADFAEFNRVKLSDPML